ncbi:MULTISPECIES: hypothetical protein [unclassified Sporosarcina]|nr:MULTISPECIES: hypothetical protein [unclassified Sporosarcina]
MTVEERGVLVLIICLRLNYSMGYVERMGDDELEALYERCIAEW